MSVIPGDVPLHLLEVDTRLNVFQIHLVGIGTVEPTEVRHRLAVVVNGRLWLLVNLTGFLSSLQHDKLPENGSVSIELETHKVEETASVFIIDGIRETKNLPISL